MKSSKNKNENTMIQQHPSNRGLPPEPLAKATGVFIKTTGTISDLLLRHHHEQIHHRGPQITHGNAGYWLVGSHAVVRRNIASCVTCKTLRGHMLAAVDLPLCRVVIGAPFTNVGFDVFGSWTVQSTKTRV